MTIRRWAVTLLAVGLLQSETAAAQAGAAGGDLPPAGYGTIRSDQLSIRLALDDIELRFLPPYILTEQDVERAVASLDKIFEKY